MQIWDPLGMTAGPKPEAKGPPSLPGTLWTQVASGSLSEACGDSTVSTKINRLDRIKFMLKEAYTTELPFLFPHNNPTQKTIPQGLPLGMG